MVEPVHLVAAVRTPIGSLNGALASVPAPRLAASCIQALVQRHKVPASEIDEVIFGNVVAAGIGQNPARQAAIFAGLDHSIGATTVNKVCGSGLKSVMMAAQGIQLGETNLAIAGGMESMSQAPYLLPGARAGYRMGSAQLVDAMIHDGLWDVYNQQHMGHFGDVCAREHHFTRQQQDDFAVRSYQRALKATADGTFAAEITPIEIAAKKQAILVSADEEPVRFDEAKLRALRPAFGAEGTITAGNASSVNDGAAAVAVASAAACERFKLRSLARIVGWATFSREPAWFTLAPIGAIQKLLDKLKWKIADVALFEINEAFSVVPLVAQRELKIPDEKLNIHGGAVALGHPIGASGARILVTLLNSMQRTQARRGIASLCIGGGEAVAVAVER
jgi:acetyl-CoA C-acetyltransferase